jgi:hypothetical protein
MAVIPGILASAITGHLVTSNFFKIATVTPSNGTGSITFSSIPSTYKSLQIRGVYQDTTTSTASIDLTMTVNSLGGSTYAYHQLYGNGSTAVAAGTISYPYIDILGGASSAYSNVTGAFIIDIIDYASTTKYKTVKIVSGANVNVSTTSYGVYLSSALIQTTSALNSINLQAGYNGMATGTTFSLYGIS